MTTPTAQVRRATVDDVQKLATLWKQEGLPSEQLEKQFKEFQVLEGEGGELLAAIGLHIVGTEGRVHSEAFAHPEHSDQLRSRLWERIQIQAKNHGLIRVWTQLDAPFWKSSELQAPGDESLARLPAEFAALPGGWLFAQLREETAPSPNVDKEFLMFREAERENTARIYRQARVMKMVAGVVAVILFVLVLIWAFFFFKFKSQGGA